MIFDEHVPVKRFPDCRESPPPPDEELAGTELVLVAVRILVMVEALPILEADTRDTEAILAVAETRDTEAILEAGIREREAGIRGPAEASGKILDMVRAEEEVVGEAEGEALC